MNVGLFSALLCVCVACLASGCEGGSRKNWDAGYEAAWEDEEAPSSFWASKEEKEGYEAGLDDSWTYDTGYYDGHEGKRPQYLHDSLYMDAFKDGKKDRERGR
jgi:hypothetical protein